MEFDFKNKTYTLRDGSEYRNYCDDAGGKYPIHGAYKLSNGEWVQIRHTPDGKMYLEAVDSDFDLIEAKKTHTVTFWVNFCHNGDVGAWPSREEADVESSYDRISCLGITRTFTEGEGLEEGE